MFAIICQVNAFFIPHTKRKIMSLFLINNLIHLPPATIDTPHKVLYDNGVGFNSNSNNIKISRAFCTKINTRYGALIFNSLFNAKPVICINNIKYRTV